MAKGENHPVGKYLRTMPSLKNRVIDARNMGMTYEKIAELEGVKMHVVAHILKEANMVKEFVRKPSPLISHRDNEVTIKAHDGFECSECEMSDANVALKYSVVLDKHFCAVCLNKITIEELQDMAQKSTSRTLTTKKKFELLLIELF